MPVATDWFFGNRKESYARARKNTAAMAAELRGTSEEDARTALAALDGDESFLLGTLPSGEDVRIAAREVGRHGMVWGSSGAGKSYGLVIITNGWSSGGARRLQLIDPKGETVLMKSLHVAADYLDLPETEREAFAARFRVFDVTHDALTPFNLFAVPKGMSPSLLASLRAAATRHMSGHDYSDLMEYGVFLLYSAAINMQCGITVKFVRAFFLDAEFRARMILPKIADARLRDSIEHIETTLPTQTRTAIVRQFDILLSSAPARISFGLSPAMVQSLAPADPRATDFLGNFGPTPQRSPALAKDAKKDVYKLFNRTRLRDMVISCLVAQLRGEGLITGPDPTVQLVLVAGKVYSKDEPKLRTLFAEKGWTFIGPAEVAAGLRAFADRGYENDVVTFVTKLIERNS